MKLNLTDYQQQMVIWRRDLHQIPEIGNELPQTSAYIQQVLRQLGVPFTTLMNGNAIVGLIKGERPGRTIALRADMDGLPVEEQTGLPFASTNGNMHACGHDGHVAMLLGAAAYLIKNNTFSGCIKLLFQPGEEFPGGAKPMIEEGALENPAPEAIFGLHEGFLHKDIPPGSIGFKSGAMMAAMDRFVIHIIGKGAHGAYPEMAVDPIPLAAELILALQTLISREKKATEPAILSVCRIQGGYNQNIIPDSVELEGTVRTVNSETRTRIARRIEELARHITASRGATATVNYDFKYPPLINDRQFTELAINAARKIAETDVYEMSEPVMGGEDMAYFLEKVPGTYAFMSNPCQRDGTIYPHHNSRFDVDESAFIIGATLHVQVCLDYLSS